MDRPVVHVTHPLQINSKRHYEEARTGVGYWFLADLEQVRDEVGYLRKGCNDRWDEVLLWVEQTIAILSNRYNESPLTEKPFNLEFGKYKLRRLRGRQAAKVWHATNDSCASGSKSKRSR
eukprot:767671-Hanusia_phi.AAC.1